MSETISWTKTCVVVFRAGVGKGTVFKKESFEILTLRRNEEEVLYDRLARCSVLSRPSEKIVSNNVPIAPTPLCRQPELPFLRSTGLLDYSVTCTRRPYLQYILLALGRDKIPRNLQAIIEGFSFESSDTSSELSLIIQKLKPACDVLSTDQAHLIQEYIMEAINKMLFVLRESNIQIYKGATAVLLGSTAERTKTFKPDEWDFVIFLPILWERNKQYFPFGKGVKPFYIQLDVQMEQEVESMFKKLRTQNPELEEEYVITEILKIIPAMVLKSLLGEMNFKHACHIHGKASPLTFSYKSLDIKMDISLGVRDESRVTVNNSNILVRPLEEQPPYGFYILHDYDLCPTWTFTEVHYMRSLPENIRFCYQITKCLIEEFIPSYYNRCTCLCKCSHFPSFKLKLILFYMRIYYNVDYLWTEDQWTNRIVEFFVVYNLCLRFGTINNLMSLSPHTDYTSLGLYIIVKESLEFSDNYLRIIPIQDVEENLNNLSTFTNNYQVIENYRNFFYHQIQDGCVTFDADIISAVCMLLCSLKEPDFIDKGPPSAQSICTDNSEHAQVKKTGREGSRHNGFTGKIQEHQIITLVGKVKCLLLPSDHTGELLAALWISQTDKGRLFKYKNNEVIQEIILSSDPWDMCYFDGRITVGMNEKALVTYNYNDFIQVKSLVIQHPGEATAVTKLEENHFIVCFKNENCIFKFNGEGELICSSHKIFQSPTHIITVKERNVVICDDHNITCLSPDLKFTLFVFTHSTLFQPTALSCHEREGSIFVGYFGGVLEISDTGVLINDFGDDLEIFKDKRNRCDLLCYDMNRQFLLINVQVISWNKVLVCCLQH